MNSDTENGLASRLKAAVDALGGVAAASRDAGIARTTLGAYCRGETEPRASDLRSLSRATGFRLDWLISGEGPMRAEEAAPPAAGEPVARATDPDVMGRLVEGILLIYKDLGQRLPHRNIGELAAAMHDDIVSTTDPDPAERRGAVAYALARLRKDLLTAATAPTSTKRSA